MPVPYHPTATLFAIAALAAGMATAQTIKTARFSCDVVNSSYETVLTARVNGSDEPVKFRIIWPTGKVATANFRNIAKEEDRIISSHRLGKTTITRTILASATADCILVHVIADQPGAVSFKAHFVTESPPSIRDRREIVLAGGKTQARAWVVPFESDVRDDGKGTITLDGEGEALIILNLTADPQASPISGTLTRLGEKHDPGHTPPDPHRIWEGIQEEGAREGRGEGEN